MKQPNLEDLNSSNCTERSIEIHYPEFHEYLLCNYPKELKWSERLYWFYHNLKDYPKCTCGGKLGYINLKTGYRDFCSLRCMGKNAEIQNKKKFTSLKRFGTENPCALDVIKEKTRQTNINKYGVDNPAKTDAVKKQIRDTCFIKYGVNAPMQSEQIREKSKYTFLQKYGVEHNSQIESVKQSKKYKQSETISKMLETTKESFLTSHPNIIDMDDVNFVHKCTHPECNKCTEKCFTIPKIIYHSRKPQGIELCTTIKPVQETMKNTNIELFVQNILEENHIDFITNTRSVIPPQELDIYIPSHNVAIECNGTYWHSILQKPKKYHENKFEECKSKGIQLISIWEDWMIHKRDIVKSIICSKLGIYDFRVYARQCDIREVNTKESNEFLIRNHIQGKCPSKIRIGLYYNDVLTSLMTFGVCRNSIMGNNKKKSNGFELLRFCTSLNTQVIGGANRLIKYFIDKYNPSEIISFSSNDISNGHLYEKLGFKQGLSNSSYWYIDKMNIRYHRSSFTKDMIVKRGWRNDKNGWTEESVMAEHGYMQIYDSGQTKWIWENKS